MQDQDSEPVSQDGDERDLCWELRGRLYAVLQELDVRPVDWDVVETILHGAVESIEAAT
jgi:hypothetical protein